MTALIAVWLLVVAPGEWVDWAPRTIATYSSAETCDQGAKDVRAQVHRRVKVFCLKVE